MEIGELQHREAVEGRREVRQRDLVAAHLDVQRIAPPAPVQANQAQAASYQTMDRIPVLDMQEVSAPAKDVCLVVMFEPEPLPNV